MKRMYVHMAAVLLAASATFTRVGRADEIEIDPDSFAAIAYSPSTGEFQYSYGQQDRAAAEQAAAPCKRSEGRTHCRLGQGRLPCPGGLGDDKLAWGTGYTVRRRFRQPQGEGTPRSRSGRRGHPRKAWFSA